MSLGAEMMAMENVEMDMAVCCWYSIADAVRRFIRDCTIHCRLHCHCCFCHWFQVEKVVRKMMILMMVRNVVMDSDLEPCYAT